MVLKLGNSFKAPISETPILIKAEIPDAVNLTLIDLPGLTYLKEDDV